MKSLRTSARITEVADTASRLGILYKKYPALAGDAILQPLFKEIDTLTAQLSEVIKSDKIFSELDKADTLRDTAIRKLDKILQGYTAMPMENLQQAGERLYSVFKKYGVKITRENYAVESAHIESLLADFAQPSFSADITALIGVSETIELIKNAQTNFNEKRVGYEQEIGAKNTKQKSTELKKLLLERINLTLLAYLTTHKSMKTTGYEEFIEGVKQIIQDTNESITARAKKEKDTEPKK